MDIHRINDFLCNPENTRLLTEFFHSCINEISGYSSPSFQQFANVGWTEDEYKFVHQFIMALLKDPSICSLDQEAISQKLMNTSLTIPKEMLECVKSRLIHFTDTLTTEYFQKIMPIMTDFDWRVKMIMGSSSIASIRQPLLQLDLKIKEKGSEKLEKIEMNEEELDNLIKVLESTQ